MNHPPAVFDAGRPGHSGPVRRIARSLGPLAVPIAGRRWFPLYAILHHTGRKSGRPYATPVVAFRTADGFLIPLPFGDATQWARNLFASGGGSIKHSGVSHAITQPRVVDRETAAPDLPSLLRSAAARLGIRQYVAVSRAQEAVAKPPDV